VATARLLDCNPGTVSRVLAEAGVKVRRHEPRVTLPLERIRDLYLAGLSPAAIAESLGVPSNVGAIRSRIKEMGLPRRRAGRYGDTSRERLRSSTECA
jgi:DNA-directed RNA polymerase specialized sigma24 family protein